MVLNLPIKISRQPTIKEVQDPVADYVNDGTVDAALVAGALYNGQNPFCACRGSLKRRVNRAIRRILGNVVQRKPKIRKEQRSKVKTFGCTLVLPIKHLK